MSEQAVWDALKVLLVATQLGQDVYDLDKVPGTNGVPGTLPNAFATLSVERRFISPTRSGDATDYAYRIAVGHVGRTIASAREIGDWVRGAFEGDLYSGRFITVDGIELGPIQHESSTDASKGADDRWSGSSVWTL